MKFYRSVTEETKEFYIAEIIGESMEEPVEEEEDKQDIEIVVVLNTVEMFVEEIVEEKVTMYEMKIMRMVNKVKLVV
jgi:hypothetical protein